MLSTWNLLYIAILYPVEKVTVIRCPGCCRKLKVWTPERITGFYCEFCNTIYHLDF